jgi:hypothetical protein
MNAAAVGRTNEPKPELKKVVVIALNHRRHRAISAEAAWAIDHGVEFHLVTVSQEGWPFLDPRVHLHELRVGEGAHPVPRIERLLVFRIPRGVFIRADAALEKLAGTSAAPVARPALSAERALNAGYEKVAGAFHHRLFVRFYRLLRPYILWRIADKQVLPAVGVDQADQVVVQDAGAITLGWHLARRHPDLDVAFTLDRSRIPLVPGGPVEPVPITDDVPVRAS